jgi:hypothetical protein
MTTVVRMLGTSGMAEARRVEASIAPGGVIIVDHYLMTPGAGRNDAMRPWVNKGLSNDAFRAGKAALMKVAIGVLKRAGFEVAG